MKQKIRVSNHNSKTQQITERTASQISKQVNYSYPTASTQHNTHSFSHRRRSMDDIAAAGSISAAIVHSRPMSVQCELQRICSLYAYKYVYRHL